jgi:hypothetical protein
MEDFNDIPIIFWLLLEKGEESLLTMMKASLAKHSPTPEGDKMQTGCEQWWVIWTFEHVQMTR